MAGESPAAGEALRDALLNSDLRADPRGLTIRAAYITGPTDLADLRLPHGLRFDSCAFEQPADWQRLTVANLRLADCTTPSLALNEAHIDGTLDLDGISTTTVTAEGAIIGGVLSLFGATLTNEDGVALGLDRIIVKGSAYLNSMTVTGGVRALMATIGGQLALEGSTLTNAGGIALWLEEVDIAGIAHLNSVTVTGEVRAFGATIAGPLALQGGAKLVNEGGRALSLDRAEIKGGAYLDAATVTGAIWAAHATIDGELRLDGATLTNTGRVLNLESARVGRLILTPAAVKGTIALSAAQITVLITPWDMRDLIGSELSAPGWRLGDVRGAIRHDRKAAAGWLRRDNFNEEFVPQPWQELANVYERNGQPADARWMRWKAARGVTRTSPWWSKLTRSVYGLLVGHGYYPLIAAGWLLLAIVASGMIVATNEGVFTPTATNKAGWKTPPPTGQQAPPITGATPCAELQDRSSCLNPVLYAFDNALPGTLATGQAAQWTANGASDWDMWIPYTLGGLKITSWIFVALLLAGVTGLLRKT